MLFLKKALTGRKEREMLELKNIVKKYDNTTILNDISLEIEEGEIVSILGPSGS